MGIPFSEAFMHLIAFLLVGLLAGWLAGKVVKGSGFGIFGDIGVGIVGAFIGAYIFDAMGLMAYGFIANVIMAFLGAVVLLLIVGLFRAKKK
jgi:uncharacterized membrane protein YeaQ/YmgE (transglycosylase-associated protein family)